MENNWRWFVPVGCGVLLGSALLVIFTIVYLVFGVIKSSDVYQSSLARVVTHPEIIATLGQPIEAGWMVSGNIQLSGGSGNADISYRVKGPQGEAKVYVVAKKQADLWNYSLMEVALSDTLRINLLDQENHEHDPRKY